MTETIGNRLYKIRAACGTERDPETLDDFAARVRKKTGKSYNPVTLSLLERMKRGWRVVDIEHFAAVDPLKRGRVWLAGWSESAAAQSSLVGTEVEDPRPRLRDAKHRRA